MNDDAVCSVCHKQYRTETDFLTETRRWRVCSAGHLWFNCACGSTMMIKKGKYDWYSPEKALPDEARSVFNKLGGLKDLPPIPNSVMQLQQKLQSATATPKELANELRKEPVLAAQVLQTAERLRSTRNSANPPIKALEHAIVFIGVKSLSEVLISAALHSFKLPRSDFRESEYWTHSYLTGMVAEYLMHRHKIPLNPDEVYLAGSLCNIGKLVTAFCFPTIMSKICQEVHSPTVLSTWRAAETTFRFPDHSIIGEVAAALWGLPETFMNAARRHHDVPDPRKSKPLDLYELVAVANQLAHLVLMEPRRVEQPVLDAYRARAKLSEGDLKADVAAVMKIKQALGGV